MLKMEICKNYNTKISICKFKKCKYHKIKEQEYDDVTMVPTGICPDAYYAVYPFCLGLLYDAKVQRRIKCPDGTINMELSKREILPKALTKVKKKAEVFVSEHIVSQDRVTSRIFIEIIEGGCIYHKKGNIYLFNTHKTDELCPASFYQLFPFIRAGIKGRYSCPDMYDLVYEVR